MLRAASPEQSAADARRAAERLREASNLLNSMRQQGASQQLDSLAREGERLTGEQRAQTERMRQAFDPSEVAKRSGGGQSEAGLKELGKLADDRQHMANDLSNLEKTMRDATRDLADGQHSAASKLRDALAEMQQSNLRARVQSSADMVRRGMDPNSSPNEAAITAGLGHLNDLLRQAQQSLGGGQQSPEEALDRVARLRNQIDTLTRNPGNQGGQAGQGREGGTLPNGAGYNGGRWNGDRYLGGYDPGGYSTPQGTETKQKPITQADIERAYQEALRDLNDLRQTVRGEPGPLADIQDLLRELGRLDPRRFPGNPAMIEQLHTQVLSGVDKLELQIRREMDDKQSGQVRTGDALRVPDGYQDSVAEYFRRLSKKPEAGK
jgi:hypothetical protein